MVILATELQEATLALLHSHYTSSFNYTELILFCQLKYKQQPKTNYDKSHIMIYFIDFVLKILYTTYCYIVNLRKLWRKIKKI